jgi:replicative DNA helicase
LTKIRDNIFLSKQVCELTNKGVCMTTQGKLPPNSLSGEESLLGLLLMNSDNLLEILQELDVSDFYSPAHQKIFEAIKQLHRKNKPVDLITVTLALEDVNHLTSVGGRPKLADLIEKGYMCYNPMEVVNVIKHNSIKRKILSITHEIAGQLYDPSTEALEIIQEYTEILLGLGDRLRPTTNGLRDIQTIMPNVLDDIEKLNSEEDTVSLNTGLYDLDKLTGGFPRGSFSAIVARAGMGKTTTAVQIAMNLAQQGKKVCYFSLEMTEVQLVKKIMARIIAKEDPHPKLNASNLFRSQGLKDVRDLELFISAIPAASELSFLIDEYSSTTVDHIRNELTKQVQKGQKPDVVFVDYVGIMDIESKYRNRVLELDHTLKQLRAIAKDFDVALIGLEQINRGVESQSDKRPAMKDIRGTGGYEQEAALILGLYNPDYYKPEEAPPMGILEIIVLKSRFGKPGTVKVGFEPQYNRLRNLAL